MRGGVRTPAPRGGTQRWKDWPADLRPEEVPVYSFNQLAMETPVEEVWARLVDATRWPELYENAADVRIAGGARTLGEDTQFSWRTFGLRVATRVVHFEPQRALSWRGDAWYGRGFHTWLLRETNAGCHVVTEEVQAGPLPSIGRWPLRRGLLMWHQRWLEGLRDGAH